MCFFEPSWESNSALGKARMDRLGYIKNLHGTVKELGGTVQSFCLIKNQMNDLNPTGCYVITPPKTSVPETNIMKNFTVPKTDFVLEINDSFFTSFDTGLAFPIFKRHSNFKK